MSFIIKFVRSLQNHYSERGLLMSLKKTSTSANIAAEFNGGSTKLSGISASPSVDSAGKFHNDYNNAVNKRRARCRAKQRELVKNPSFSELNVGVLLSGGGWRAMLSSAGYIDGLCDAGVFDTVSYVSGLSGGSWAATLLALSTPTFNPFHHVTPTAARNENYMNRWYYGQNHINNHSYEGLQEMLSPQRCRGILSRLNSSSSSRAVDWMCDGVVGRFQDPTFVRLLAPHLFSPKELVPKYSAFLGEQLFKGFDDGVQSRYSSPVRHLTDAREAIMRGDIPMCCVEMMAENSQGAADEWVEVNPFSAWNINRGVGGDTATLSASFEMDASVSYKLSAQHIMGISGSAFNLHVKDVVRSFGINVPRNKFTSRKLVPGQMHCFVEPMPPKNEPRLGGNRIVSRFGMEELPSAAPSATRVHLGELRDAGLSGCNVPFATAMCRNFDVLLVMDAGAGEKSAMSLYNAITMFDKPLVPNIDGSVEALKEPFGDKKVKAFQIQGGPLVLYGLGVTTPATSVVVRDPTEILRDVRYAREVGQKAGEMLREHFRGVSGQQLKMNSNAQI